MRIGTIIAFFALILVNDLSALCFVNETVTVKKTLLSQPPVVDEYHCKTLCAGMTTCFSYIHQFDHCALLGGKVESSLMCTLPNKEMVKKMNDKDCKATFAMQNITKQYIRNPATATGGIIPINTTQLRPCGVEIAVIDATLPDNSHILLGNSVYMNLTWDMRLGSWIFTEGPKILYLRGAQCIQPLDSELASTTSCGGGGIPACDVRAGFVSKASIPFGAVTAYGTSGACTRGANYYIQYRRWMDDLLENSYSMDTYALCLYGEWFVFNNIDKNRNTQRITKAVCAIPM